MIGIYKVTNLINNKVYIGQSIHIETRWKSHQNDFNNVNCSGYNTIFYNAIRKYGIDNFIFEVQEECNIAELDDKERYWIKFYNSYIGFKNCNGYNMTLGGNASLSHSSLSYNQVEEIKQLLMTSNISQVEIGKKYKVSNMTISDINRGITWVDEELNYPLRQFNIKERRLPPISKEKLYQLIIDNHSNFSETSRQLGISRTTLVKWCKKLNLPTRASDYKTLVDKNSKFKRKGNYTNICKAVCMLDKETNQVLKSFDSISEAASFLQRPSVVTHISEVCNGQRKTAGGYKWCWANKERKGNE